ncbi:hypothetical protein L6164_029967 [Bauhinia variegata]|uniref:Uncharacterized protein n=1 Tax=Bauhinia variegata TaxID=167791 RepID=A0ACB9LB67_BAUVA|nr:hypothetical protein L6164_029967 [Bauhinia variegata]
MDAIFLQSGIISASLQVILDRFSTFAQKEIGLLLGVDDELKKLERTLFKVQALVDSVKSKQQYWSCSNKGKQLWLHDL